MAYINVFRGAQQISEGDGSNPLVVGPLNASVGEVSAPIELDVKCEAGFKTYGDTTISFVGTTAAKWEICATETGTYGSTLVIPTEIGEAGTKFYVKARATSDENPVNDVSVDIRVNTTIQAV